MALVAPGLRAGRGPVDSRVDEFERDAAQRGASAIIESSMVSGSPEESADSIQRPKTGPGRALLRRAANTSQNRPPFHASLAPRRGSPIGVFFS